MITFMFLVSKVKSARNAPDDCVAVVTTIRSSVTSKLAPLVPMPQPSKPQAASHTHQPVVTFTVVAALLPVARQVPVTVASPKPTAVTLPFFTVTTFSSLDSQSTELATAISGTNVQLNLAV